MQKRIDHIGIAVKSLESVKKMMEEIFEIVPDFEEMVEEQRVKVLGYKIGESSIEFLEPMDDKSPISKFLQKKGEGIHHFCLGVENVSELLNKMKSNSVRLIDEVPRPGAEGKSIAFVHPYGFFGTLLELSQEND
jgi:methylmalonyl-CoA/ethylmalonyl-CoA epimerase